MRYPPGHKERTRARIVEAAAAAFRREGYHASGVDRVMEEAGLTPGGFYAHFPSKEALLAEALVQAATQAAGRRDPGADEPRGRAQVEGFLDRYLGAAHRDGPEAGCPFPVLAAEVARAGPGPREAFEGLLGELVDRLSADLPPGGDLPARERALGLAALSVGGILLSRAVADPALADEILAACRMLGRECLPPEGKTPEAGPRQPPRSKRHTDR